jgi:hypothetical protein
MAPGVSPDIGSCAASGAAAASSTPQQTGQARRPDTQNWGTVGIEVRRASSLSSHRGLIRLWRKFSSPQICISGPERGGPCAVK